jgi:copper homeostasis protein
VILEICCSSDVSVQNAVQGGADRIELCTNLLDDGLTPDDAFMERVHNTVHIPVHVLIRPRAGNFVYTDAETKQILVDIDRARAAGFPGVVIGALNDAHTIPDAFLKMIVDAAQGLDLTFHKAFDVVADPFYALDQLIDAGFDRILTSGQQKDAETGLERLVALKNHAAGRITIMPGGGVSNLNCRLFLEAGFTEIHSSAKNRVIVGDPHAEPISDLGIVRQMKEMVQ